MEDNSLLNQYPFLPTRFVSLDFETTGLTASDDKIIEVGAVKFNLLTNEHDTYTVLINPNTRISSKITRITGITNDMLKGGSSIEEELPFLKTFVEDLPIICHNAPFDTSFLNYEADRLNIAFNNKVYCSLQLAKAAFDLPKYNLAAVAEYCGIPIGTTHRALDDAILAGQVFVKAAAALGTLEPRNTRNYNGRVIVKGKDFVPNTSGAHTKHTVVFTGNFDLSKVELAEIAANAGMTIKDQISKKVTLLVIGEQDLSIVGDTGKSTKQRKAEEYNEQGLAEIEFLDEDDFIVRFS